MAEPLRPDIPGPISTLYGRAVAPERPLYCACGLAFDTGAARAAHWARPMRHGPHPKGRRVRHGSPTLPYTTFRAWGAGPIVSDREAPPTARGPACKFDATAPRCTRVHFRPRLLREPRRRRVRITAPAAPVSDAWRARGRASPIDVLRPPPTLPTAPLPRDWTLTAGAAEQPGTITHGLTGTIPWSTVFESDVVVGDRGPSATRVRTADAARVTALRRAWNRPGRWCLVETRPDPEHGRLWRVTAGYARKPDKVRRTPSAQLRAAPADTTFRAKDGYWRGAGAIIVY